jgi:DNA-binding SARP family transcriptional activator/tetratricopeptide (TPR) repeat protein
MTTEAGKTRGLRIRLLGELAVFRGGPAMALPPSKKTRALLAYLAATGRPHLREQLCALLWDGPDDPRAQLRWSLAKLRPILDEAKQRRLRADRDHIALDMSDVSVDLASVDKLAQADLGALDTAALVALAGSFAGSFLDGLELSGCFRFHAWCVAQRERLHAMHVRVTSLLVERLHATPALALPHARALVALDPLAESSHITLVRLLGEIGRPRQAMEQYERWRQLLAHELGGKPSREMEAARMALSKATAGAPVGEPHLPAPATERRATGIPLAGRSGEMALLEAKLEAAVAGHCREVVLLLGDPGIGKSRLLEELAARARRLGGQVLAGRAFEAEMIRPYGAWLDALRSSGAALTGPAESSGPQAPDLTPSPVDLGEHNPMFDKVVARLRGLVRESPPLVLVLDDLQWLDEASGALLHFVVRAVAGLPVLIACAARAGELSDNPKVLRLLRALEREGRLLQAPLPPLDDGAIRALVGTVAAAADVGAVCAGCEGNPLFAIEMARALARGERGVASTLRVLIDERLDRLDDRAQALLPFAAAMGRSFDPRILERVLDLPAAELSGTLGDLERRGVLRASGAGAYDFSHDLIRQAAYQQLSEPRRRLCHLQLARVLATWPDPEGELAGDLAHHAALGGDAELAARAYLTAAQRSTRLFAWGETTLLCRRGIEQLPSLPRATRLHLHVELLGVEVMGKPSVERAREIEVELLRTLTEAEEAGLHADVVRGYYLRSVLQFRTENPRAAAETMFRAMRTVQSVDPVTGARTKAEAGRCLILLERDIGKAKELLEAAQTLLPAGTDDLMLAWGMGLLKRYLGEPEEAEQRLGHAAQLARRIESHWEETECLRSLTLLAIEQGDLAKASGHCRPLLALAEKMGEGSERPIAAVFAALVRVLAGDAGAEPPFAAAVVQVRVADAKGVLATVLNFAAEYQLDRGDSERATALASEALAAANAVERSNQIAIATALLARLAHRAGQTKRARELIEPLRPEAVNPLTLSLHARRAVERALRETSEPATTKSGTQSRRPTSIMGN